MGLFDKKDGGFMNVIRCDEPSYLIWKWHPSGTDPQRADGPTPFGGGLRCG